jgi:hypothetical protein
MVNPGQQLSRPVQLSIRPIAAIVCTVRNKLQQVRFYALPGAEGWRKVLFMTQCRFLGFGRFAVVCGLLGLVAAPARIGAEAAPAAVAAFNSYIGTVESRLTQQHRQQSGFLALLTPAQDLELRLRRGELIVERITPSATDMPGAMLYHWRGTAFAAGAKAADFERLMKNFNAYPRHYAPQVMQAKVLAQDGDHFQASMRVRQKHVITVVMDTDYDVVFGRLDARHGYSISRSTRIAEVDAPGTNRERTLGPGEEHGFLWRLNTYWSCEERDGGLYMQIESVSLTRSIPTGLGWAVGPFVESVPRESLEFTLRSTREALRR